eukprot:scaffold625_cov169-Skeletonema_dohrnii-CCMP3373.AAC.6
MLKRNKERALREIGTRYLRTKVKVFTKQLLRTMSMRVNQATWRASSNHKKDTAVSCGTSDALWRRLEAKYGVPVKHAWEWDDEEEDGAKDDDEAAKDLDGEG